MLTPMKIAIAAALTLLPAAARAETSCFTIKDPDQRAYCRAIASKSVGDCSVISDFTLRQTCRARFESPSSPGSSCNSITTAWERQKCRDTAGKR